jgi:hypothetical protein
MGYDPTVHRVDDRGLRYIYEIPTEAGTRYFKTADLLYHRRVPFPTGGNTRVWSAIEVGGITGNAINEKVHGDKKVALKDVWIDEGSKTEKENLNAIVDRLRKVKEDDYQWAPPSLQEQLKSGLENDGYKKYFMDIVCDSFDFGRSKETSGHATPAPGMLRFRGKDRVTEDRNMLERLTQKAGYSRIPRSVGEMTLLKTPLDAQPRSYTAKLQYRLVYEEVGESLSYVDTLRTAFSALSDAYIGKPAYFLR